MKNPNPPPTDEEVCRKFRITTDHECFAVAKSLATNRPDRVICVIPAMTCPHCCHEFTATWHDLTADDPQPDDTIACPGCERWIWIERIDQPGDEDFDPEMISVTLNTHPLTED